MLRNAIEQDTTTCVRKIRAVNTSGSHRFVKMSEKRISLGINVSILVILMIFGVLLSLPLRLLLNTNYARNETNGENDTAEATQNATFVETPAIPPLDHRRLKLCPSLQYEDRLKSVFSSDYDGNCTYARASVDDGSKKNNTQDTIIEKSEKTAKLATEIIDENLTESREESVKEHRTKSVPLAGHILVTMLLISAIAALVEVLRIRFARDKSRKQKLSFRNVTKPHKKDSRSRAHMIH